MAKQNCIEGDLKIVPEVATDADREARRQVGDLHTPRPAIYWTDLLLSALIGWTAFAAAVAFKPFSWRMTAACLVAVFALYRGLCFLHEISHLRQRALRGFETTWNILLGMPMLMPSIMYVGVHQNHHKLSTYGTTQDPEYLPFSGQHLMIVLFGVQSLLVPLLLIVRFLFLSPISLLSPRVHTWLAVRATALSMNVQYRREVPKATSRKIARWEAATLIAWCGLVGLAAFRVLPWRFFAIWCLVSAAVSLVNTVRTLGAHRYTSDGTPLDRYAQLGDSIDTPGAFWTELWAPVGLRYHAMHHYFPGIPYHNLGEAYRRLMRSLGPGSTYSESTSPSLPHSLETLYRGERT